MKILLRKTELLKANSQKFKRELRKKIFIIAILFLLPTICEAQNLLSRPQKIVIDSKRDRLLVSNFGSGNIVQIDNTGKMKQSYFATGSNFIDGLEIVGDTVYGVGTNRHVRGYDLETKLLVMDVKIPGSGVDYLSSIASDSSGHLLISCPGEGAIYKLRISDGSYWIFAKDEIMRRPNGILLERENNRIVVIDDIGWSTINAISLTDSTVSNLITTTLDRPDGIVRDKYGNYYIGGYYLPGIYKLKSDFSEPPVLYYSGNNFVYPTYDEVNNELLVTLYENNSWKKINLQVTGIESEVIDNDILLNQNYPNPFNPLTTIKYSISKSNDVNITVFDVLGNEIKSIVDEFKLAGNYEINFNADNLSSGIYLYCINSGDFSQIKKMTLLK